GGGDGRYSPSDHKGRGGNPTLTGDIIRVGDANTILMELADKEMAADPSLSRYQAINRAALTPQFSEAFGRAKAEQIMEQARRFARQFGPAHAPGFQGG